MNSFSTYLKNQSLDIGLKTLLLILIVSTASLKAQTPTDGLMMGKGKMCNHLIGGIIIGKELLKEPTGILVK